ncbi:hypothetical protein DOZ80_21570 [Pseudomonas fluorescens]|uniref:Uncharacterized protein n=2 Tax=Pseudomonas fluorescens TaxID=294 RepID=A0A327MUI6_PSEFL|nr:hypothetical protein DOZ80_21570 [Pseudomonas fluorescens]
MHSTLDVVRAQLPEAEPLLKRLDQELETIKFDPDVPSSVEAATRRVTEAIDGLLSRFKGNPILGPLASQLKVQYVEAIQQKVVPTPETNV